jgi:hypothetical protein
MQMQNKVLAPLGKLDRAKDHVQIDLNAFIRRLILFDEVIVESIRLKDIPQLAYTFGVDGLVDLLKSGIVRIHCSALTTGQVGQTTALSWREKEGALPLGSFEFVPIDIADQKEYIANNIRFTNDYVPRLKDAIKVKRAILDTIIENPADIVPSTFQGLRRALLGDNEITKLAVSTAAHQFHGKSIPLTKLELEIESIKNSEYRTRSNVAELLSISEQESHKIVERGILNLSGLYQRLSYMHGFNSSAWFHEEDVPLLNRELSRLSTMVTTTKLEEPFIRIQNLLGLPDITPSKQIDIRLVMKLRESKECRDFRQWLESSEDLSNKEIGVLVNSFSEKISRAVDTIPGRAIRLAVSAGIGSALAGPAAGITLSAIEDFTFKYMVKKPGPISLINNHLRRLYE